MLVGYQQGTGIGCADSTFDRDLFLCEQAGFEAVGCYEFMKKTQANEKNEKVVFVCRKKAV